MNKTYRDYEYGMWLVKITPESEPIVMEGYYGIVVENVKKMDGYNNNTSIEKVAYKNVGRRKVKVDKIWIAKHDICPNGVVGVEWYGDPGFGRFELILDEDGKFHAMTEHMDINTQKLFSRDIMNAILRDIIIDD